MNLEILKKIGKGTPHQFLKEQVTRPLPSKNKNEGNNSTPKFTVNKNRWDDVSNIGYQIHENNLIISANEYFPETILDYINSIPNELNIKIVLMIYCRKNETAGFNMLCDSLSRIKTNKQIILRITDMRFGRGIALDVENLPDNVKISNIIDNYGKEEDYYGENSLDWWSLHLSDNDFDILTQKLTPSSKKRIIALRTIAINFYNYMKSINRTNASVKEKSDIAYNWCCNNIRYDNASTLADGSFNYNCRYSQDPIETYKRKKGVCAGRARLLKVMLNNKFMNVNCFLVTGMTGNLQHEWNEVIDETGKSLHYDISKAGNLWNVIHNDYELSLSFLKGQSRR